MVKNIEDIIKEKKEELHNIKAPENMEERLTKALDEKSMKKKRKNKLGKIVAMCLVVLLVGYNFDAFAFYGKRILGYDNVMSGTLKDLSDSGEGQIIDESHTFSNGVTITLDAIMMDDSQLLAFYTVKDPSGNVDDMLPTLRLKGFINEYYPEGGQGKSNDEGTVMKYIQSFEPPYFFERTLHFRIHLFNENINEQGEITFKIDRDKAMGHNFKVSIDETIELDGEEMKFESILSTPTRTVINGSIQNILDLGIDVINKERIRPVELDLRLYANGEELAPQGGGLTTDLKGITFHHEYDPLPDKLNSLQLKLVSFSADHDVEESIDMDKNIKNNKINIEEEELIINDIYEDRAKTFVTITTEENTVLTDVYLLIDDKRVELNRTIDSNYEKQNGGKIFHTRTLEFNGLGEDYKLDIKRITYSEKYNRIIDLPIK